MIYLASPYSHPNPRVREDRAYQAGCFAALLRRRDIPVFAPIPFWHHLAIEHNLPKDAASWWRYNRTFLAHCSDLYVLKLEGWSVSQGVMMEIDFATDLYMPTHYFNGETFAEEKATEGAENGTDCQHRRP